MGDIDDFFDLTKRFERYEISPGTIAGRIVSKPCAPKKLTLRDVNETTYAQKYIIENQAKLLQSSDDGCFVDGVDADDESDGTNDDIYDRYDFNVRTIADCDLPIMRYESTILDAIEMNTAIVIHAATGSGKTTQVPQFILDDACFKKKYCSIVVTQPRRIAAASNANRVATERGWVPGTIVGYQIGLDQRAHFTEDTRILYCTTGLLLERLIQSHDFEHFTHIVIDEVHERSKEIDFLLIVIRKLFGNAMPKPKVKFILMSATFDADAFAKYFEFPKGEELVPAKIVRIEEKSQYKVCEFYFDDLMELSSISRKIRFLLDKPGIDDELYSMAVALINCFEDIDADEFLIAPYVIEIPAVLVFLPGIHEINRMQSELKDKWPQLNTSTKLLCVVLHSGSSNEQRELAMQFPEPNVRKIILATNIAESSITVPDVKYVIDFCLMRQLVTDRTTNFTSLQLTWTAQNNCVQRMGRAGRVMNGRCYRLVTKYFYENLMPETLPPELIRCPLENIALKAKKLNLGPPDSILALAMNKPKLSDIANTIVILKEAGALLRSTVGASSELDGDLTFIGRIMAELPVDIKVAKLITLGYCFGVLEECLVIGAALTCNKPMFRNYSRDDAMRSYSLQLEWANGTGSDLLAMYNAFRVWSHKHECGDFDGKQKQMEMKWMQKYGIDYGAMYECRQLIDEFSVRLKRLDIVVNDGSAKYVRWKYGEKTLILKAVIAGAFYPNFFVPKSGNELRTFGVHDPRNTVYLKGFPRDNVRCLYTKAIKEIFVNNGLVNADQTENMRVLFDEGSEKIFVTFKSMLQGTHQGKYGVECMPGKITIEVYKALKMRKMGIRNHLRVIGSSDMEMKYAQDNGIEIDQSYHQITKLQHLDRICVPRILDKFVVGFITHIRSCDQFWFQPLAQFHEIKAFNEMLMESRINMVKRFDSIDEISVGQILLVKTKFTKESTPEYYRAKVLYINRSWREPNRYRLFLIDFGIIDHFEFDYLRDSKMIASDFMRLPPRCFECALAELQPSSIKCPEGVWPTEAINCFEEFANEGEVEAQIYSVSDGVVHVFLRSLVSKVTLSDVLKKKSFAEFAEESHASKTNHKQRIEKQMQSSQTRENHVESAYIKHLTYENSLEVPLPPSRIRTKEIRLQGPFSPVEVTALCPMTEVCRMREAKIDPMSVNSVLLDNDPHQTSERCIVAATVSDTGKMNDILLRATTFLPNIRAFGPLMAAIFCQTMELKRNKAKTKYVAMRTGLGYDYWNKRPVFEEHDIVINLDTEITIDDIRKINKIRGCLSTLLYTSLGQERTKCSVEKKPRLIVRLIQLIIKLLETQRKPIEVETESFSWNLYDEDEILNLEPEDASDDRAVFPPHRVVKIYTDEELYVNEMRSHCEQLKMLAESDAKTDENRKIFCKLCMHRMDTLFHLRGHLKSPYHCDKYFQICQD